MDKWSILRIEGRGWIEDREQDKGRVVKWNEGKRVCEQLDTG
jgi:hypothetical protein